MAEKDYVGMGLNVLKRTLVYGGLGAALATGLFLAKDFVNTELPTISVKVRQALGMSTSGQNVDLPDFDRTINMDEVDLGEIVNQLITTTYENDQFVTGMMYLLPDNTRVVAGGKNIYDKEKTEGIIDEMKLSNGKIEVFVGDEGEGGFLKRTEIGLPPAEYLGQYYEGNTNEDLLQDFPDLFTVDGELPNKAERVENIERLYSNAASTLQRLNVNYVLSPVIDTVEDVNDSDNVISASDRGFSNDSDIVIELATMYIDAMHKQGIRVVGKHYVGTGFSNADPHMYFDDSEILTDAQREEALKPFKGLIDKLDGIMITHLPIHTKGKPDSVNPEAYRFIREDLGFEGLIITDDICMGAMRSYYQNGEGLIERGGENWKVQATIDALEAGADVVIIKRGPTAGLGELTDVVGDVASNRNPHALGDMANLGEDIIPEVLDILETEMRLDSDYREMMTEKFRRVTEFKGYIINGLEEKVDRIAAGEQGHDAIWVSRKVKSGETFLDILASERPDLINYDSNSNPSVKPGMQADVDQIMVEFRDMNHNQDPNDLRKGFVYKFPDFTQDGIIARTHREEMAELDVTMEGLRGLPIDNYKVKRGDTLYELFERQGLEIYDESGNLKPIKSGDLRPHYLVFMEDNPGTSRSLRRCLVAGKTYQLRDYDGETSSVTVPIDNSDSDVSSVTVTTSASKVDVINYRLGRNESFYGVLAGEGIKVTNSRGRMLPVTSGSLEPHYTQFKQDNPNVTNLNRLNAGQSYKFRDLNGDGRITYQDPSVRVATRGNR